MYCITLLEVCKSSINVTRPLITCSKYCVESFQDYEAFGKYVKVIFRPTISSSAHVTSHGKITHIMT